MKKKACGSIDSDDNDDDDHGRHASNTSTTPQVVSKSNHNLKTGSKISTKEKNRVTKETSNKKLSFYPLVEGSDDASDSSSSFPINIKDNKTNSKDSELLAVNDLKPDHNLASSDNDDATSTGSCSCEDHSSVAGKSDDDPHGDLDYDEDSITNSPTNGIDSKPRAEAIRKQPITGAPSNHEHHLSGSTKLNSDKIRSDEPALQKQQEEDTDDINQNRSRLKSFLNLRCSDSDPQAFDIKLKKDRTHKSYNGLMKYFYKDACYFQIKSINHENVHISKSMGVWSTPTPNEIRLNIAFREHRNVILIFSVQQSGAFQGFARMTGESKPTTRVVPWVLPARLNPANLSGVFSVEWLCMKELSFNDTRDLFNPLNDNKPIKVARDGQQVDSTVGRELCQLFPRDSKKRLLASIETLKAHSGKKKPVIHPKAHYYPMQMDETNRHFKGASYFGNGRVPMPLPAPYPQTYMNGCDTLGEHLGTSQPNNHHYDQQFYSSSSWLPAYSANSRGRMSGRRRGALVENAHQFRAGLSAQTRFQNHHVDLAPRPTSDGYNSSGTGPHTVALSTQGPNTILDNSHDGFYTSHHHHYAQPMAMPGPYYNYAPQHHYPNNSWDPGAPIMNSNRYHPYQRLPKR